MFKNFRFPFSISSYCNLNMNNSNWIHIIVLCYEGPLYYKNTPVCAVVLL
jgi:hypothetical protein